MLQTRLFPEALVAHVCQEPILWANVLRLAVDELLAQKRDRDAWELLSRCCQPYLASRAAIEAAVIAFQTVEKAGLFAAIPPDRLIREDYETVRASAQKMLIDYEQVAPEQRDIAGRLLGSGPGHDPRPGVGLRADHLPEIDWVEIPKVDPQTHKSAWTYQNKEARAAGDLLDRPLPGHLCPVPRVPGGQGRLRQPGVVAAVWPRRKKIANAPASSVSPTGITPPKT